MFGLVDCNNFYASCERVFRPDLIGKPVVVLSNNDGCVIARSNEAKALGIPMGAPAFEYDALFNAHHVQVFSANFALYGDMSNRVMDILSEYTPEMEIYSIDEAFLKFEGFKYFDLQACGLDMQKRVTKSTGIPISVGIAPTKSLAKIANKIAKKFAQQTQSVYAITDDEKRIKALKWTKVEDIWGVGRQHAKRLCALGVNNAHQFAQLDKDWVQKHMSIVGLRLHQDLNGIPTLDLEEAQPKQNIATTRSFDKNFTTLDELKERVTTFAVSCAEKLRKQGSCCNAISVFVHTNRFRKDLPQYARSIVVQLPFASNSNYELVKYANIALARIYKPGYHYKKAGVIVLDFTPEDATQLTMFGNSNPKHAAIMQTIDKLNAAYGRQKVKLAAQDLKRMWVMKQEKLSPRYTTNLKDIIVVNC